MEEISSGDSKLVCNSKVFDNINQYAKDHPDIKDEVIEANVLYNNAKFYYSAGETVGALVSYSCAAVLINSILRKLPSELPAQSDMRNLMNVMLQVVQTLQQQIGSGGSNKKDDDASKDWAKICTKIKPLVFKKGGADCLFYNAVAGLQKEKDLIDSSLIFPLIYPNLYPKTSKGILIYGPPGTGKTYLVKAAVNELQAKDDTVGVLFFTPSPGDLKGKYVGETEKRIEEIFRCARDAACEHEANCPEKKKFISIIFMDEMDAIAPNRDKDTTGLAVNSVNTLLQMMDGVKSFPNVTVVGATNYPWNLDDAILRRFDTQILINVPKAVDLKALFNIEMNRMLNLESDRSKYDYCKTNMTTDKDESNSLTGCTLQCVNEPIVERYLEYPYNMFDIDYFNNNKENGLIDSIIYKIEASNFSNSDLNRLIKAATTNAGELAVKANLFYSLKMIGDYQHDQYMSCLTNINFRIGQTDEIDYEKKAQNSIDILKEFVKGGNPSNIVQITPPKYVRILCTDSNRQKYWYYNTKCLLYKNSDVLVQHYSIKDIYIKGHPESVSVDNFTPEEYIQNILGTTREKLNNPETRKNFDKIDIIMAFDFTFKQTANAEATNTLLPVSRDLIDYVFMPQYNEFQRIRNQLTKAEGITSGATSILEQKMRGKSPPAVPRSESNKFGQSDGDSDSDDDVPPLILNAFAPAVPDAASPASAAAGTGAAATPSVPGTGPGTGGAPPKDVITERLEKTKSEIDQMNFTEKELSDIKDDNFIVRSTQNNFSFITLNSCSMKITYKFLEEWDNIMGKKFASFDSHNLDFYNYLLLYKLVNDKLEGFVEANENKIHAAAQKVDDLNDDETKDFIEENKGKDIQEQIATTTDEEKKQRLTRLNNKKKALDEADKEYNALTTQQYKVNMYKTTNINYNENQYFINHYLNSIDYSDFINQLDNIDPDMLNKLQVVELTSIDKNIIESLYLYEKNNNDGKSTKNYIITLNQYKKYIKYITEYEPILVIPEITDDVYISIDFNFFQILFKDIFKGMNISTNMVQEYYTPNITQKIIQLYMNDVMRDYELQKIINRDDAVKLTQQSQKFTVYLYVVTTMYKEQALDHGGDKDAESENGKSEISESEDDDLDGGGPEDNKGERLFVGDENDCLFKLIFIVFSRLYDNDMFIDGKDNFFLSNPNLNILGEYGFVRTRIQKLENEIKELRAGTQTAVTHQQIAEKKNELDRLNPQEPQRETEAQPIAKISSKLVSTASKLGLLTKFVFAAVMALSALYTNVSESPLGPYRDGLGIQAGNQSLAFRNSSQHFPSMNGTTFGNSSTTGTGNTRGLQPNLSSNSSTTRTKKSKNRTGNTRGLQPNSSSQQIPSINGTAVGNSSNSSTTGTGTPLGLQPNLSSNSSTTGTGNSANGTGNSANGTGNQTVTPTSQSQGFTPYSLPYSLPSSLVSNSSSNGTGNQWFQSQNYQHFPSPYSLSNGTGNPGGGRTIKNKKIFKQNRSFNKRKNNSRASKSFKNIKHKKTTHTLRNKKYKGGANTQEILDFIRFCNLNSKDTDISPDNLSNVIAGKTIFIKTSFNSSELHERLTHGIASDIYWGAEKLFKTAYNMVSSAPAETEEQKRANLIVELSKKQTLLPLYFNNVEMIGSIVNYTDDTPASTIVDDKKIEYGMIIWSDCSNILTQYETISEFAQRFLGTSQNSGNIDRVLQIMIAGAGAGGLPVAASVYFSTAFLVNMYNMATNKSNTPKDIAKSTFINQLFTVLVEKNFVDCETFDRSPNNILLVSLQDSINNLNSFFTFLNNDTISHSNLFFSPGYIDAYGGVDQSNEYTAPKQISDTEYDKYADILSSDKLTKYTSAMILDKDIKSKLINFNIPMSSFYYALNLVKSTYNKDVAPLLVDYHNNRDLFLEKQKQREAKAKK